MFQSVLIFIVFLGPLIFFHELGHFFFARFFGVRVEVFSIGFGPKLFKWKRNDTEYAVSAIPLGGYVKMFGDDPFREQQLTDEEKKVAFNHKSKWARFWIVFGGPLANLILAFFLYFGLVMTGEKVPETRFGSIPQSSLLYDMGIRSGDTVRSINGRPLVSFDDLNVAESTINEIGVERQGQVVIIKPGMNSMQFVDLMMEHSAAGLRAALLTDINGKNWAITRVSGVYNPSFSLEEAAVISGPLYLQSADIKNEEGTDVVLGKTSELLPSFSGESEFWKWANEKQLFAMDKKIGSIVMQSPADKAGLKQGDIITSLNGEPITSFEWLRGFLQKVGKGKEVEVGYLREGKPQTVKLLPEEKEVNKKMLMTIGIFSGAIHAVMPMRETKSEGLLASAITAFDRTVDGVVKTISGYKKLITKEVSLNNIGGPLAIGKVASDSFNISLSMFFRLMALISINLGIINLFPIPVLDGGHIMFLGFEIINRGPLSRRKLELAQRFGVSFLFLLIFIALFNDITRIIS